METQLRNKIWYALVEAKYRAIYASHFANRTRVQNRILDVVLAITTSGSVAAWTFWQDYPEVWACLIAAGQIVQLLRPVLTSSAKASDVEQAMIFYTRQAKAYEWLWEKCDQAPIPAEVNQQLKKLEQEELDQLEKMSHFSVPEIKSIVQKSVREHARYLKIQLNIQTYSS